MVEELIKKKLLDICNETHIKNFEAVNNEQFKVICQCKLVDGDTTEDKCDIWIKKFSACTSTNWITKRRFPKPTRYIFRKLFACQHSSLNKVSSRKRQDCRDRNKKCDASIDLKFKKINRDTIRNDPLLKEGINVIININFCHSHKINVAEAYSYLRLDSNTLKCFNTYFHAGMTVASAKTYHEMKLLESEEVRLSNISSVLANAQINPTERQIKYMYDKWRKTEYGGRDEKSVIEKLRSKIPDFKQSGVEILIRESPMVVVVVTPIMLRTFLEEFSNEMIFIDSSGSCDQTSTYVTFIFTANKVGALPLACILHTAQTEANYALAFSATKETLELSGKIFSPKVIMTDDSSAERNALKEVFPSAHLLLCTFHLCQAMWRWLWHSSHKVQKEDRRIIMQMFREILYSDTPEDAEENYKTFISNEKVSENSLLCDHVTKLWERRLEWCISFRKYIITRGNNTNNYTEASIRIFKDVILQRCKVFNSCALVDFIVNTFECYYKRRLIEFANSRRSKPQLDYKNFCSRSKKIDRIFKISENIYHIASEKDSSLLYTVNTGIGFCDCPSGASGSFCKHLCALQLQFGFLFQNSPLLTHKDKVELARIALGEEVSADFFQDMDFKETHHPEICNTDIDFIPPTEFQHPQTDLNIIDLSENHKEALETFRTEFTRISKIFEENTTPESTTALIKLNNILCKIQTPAQALNFAAEKHTRSKKIKVQPTSIARRKNRGLSRGSNRIQAGRPSEAEQKRKRKHDLSDNIRCNQPNAKIH